MSLVRPDSPSLLQLAITQTNLSLMFGDLHDAIRAGRIALEQARAHGRGENWAASIVAHNVAEALLELGRVDDARALIVPLTGEPVNVDNWSPHDIRVELDAIHGLLDEAWLRLEPIIAAGRHVSTEFLCVLNRRAAEVALWRGQPEVAGALVRAALSRNTTVTDAHYLARLLTCGMRVHADQAALARAHQDSDGVADALAAGAELAAAADAMPDGPFASRPHIASAAAEHATWSAERARLHGADEPEMWDLAAEAWHALDRPHRTAYALWRQAEALLAANRSAGVPPVLRRAAELAATHAPLRHEIEALARRARINLAPPRPALTGTPTKTLYGLTARELEVLALLAVGRTNAEIAAALYISPKTASVHVTSILRKLAVKSRVQAAALAERAGLAMDDSTAD
jgi:DNA-binding CsgD family transcriptional regulator